MTEAFDTNEMKNLLNLIFFIVVYLGTAEPIFASTYNLNIGEEQYLKVPDVSLGYVDKAIWACSTPGVIFVSKSETGATVKIQQYFEGTATVELLYVVKYTDSKGFTRANTYTKNYYLTCIYNGSDASGTAKSIFIEPEKIVQIGEKVRINYKLLPEGSTAKVSAWSYPGTFFNGITNFNGNQYIEGWARSTGIDKVTVSFTVGDETISATCKIFVVDPTWTSPTTISVEPIYMLAKNDKLVIKPVLTPANANTIYDWKIDDKKVVSFYDGEFHAIGEGMTTVKVTTRNGLTATILIVVKDASPDIPGLKKAIKRVGTLMNETETELIK